MQGFSARPLGIVLALAFVLGLPAVGPGRAAAQEDRDAVRRLERQLRDVDASYRLSAPADRPISERLLIDYGASIRFGLFAIDDASSSTRMLRQTDGRLFLLAELDGAHRFFGRLRFVYNDFNEGDDFDGEGDELEDPIGDRYEYEFDLRGAILAASGLRSWFNLNLKVGRQYVQWGSGLALGNVLYAVQADLELGDVGFVGLAGLTPRRDTVDFDASRPSFDRRTERAFFGGRAEYRGLVEHRPYAFYLAERDLNDDDEPAVIRTSGGLDVPTRFDYDSSYVGIGSRGSLGRSFAYRVEAVHEFGEGLCDSLDRRTGVLVAQEHEQIAAFAGLVTLTYLARDDSDTRVDLELVAGSGDGDRFDSADTFAGNRRGTKDQSFNALGYVYTGLALVPDPANLLLLRVGPSSHPLRGVSSIFERLRLGLDGFLFFKIEHDAPINVATQGDTFVGGEVDLEADWRITSDVTATVRYGVFIAGPAMPRDQNDCRHFFYAGLAYAF